MIAEDSSLAVRKQVSVLHTHTGMGGARRLEADHSLGMCVCVRARPCVCVCVCAYVLANNCPHKRRILCR